MEDSWVFVKKFEVDWGDQDANHHVNNLVFFSTVFDDSSFNFLIEWFQEARHRWFVAIAST